MAVDDPIPVDETMENSDEPNLRGPADAGKHLYLYLAVVLVAAAIYLGCIVSPPSLMDDVDAVQAQIARNMLDSGDWVTARLDGIAYLEKSPLIYWLIADFLQDLRRARLGGAAFRWRLSAVALALADGAHSACGRSASAPDFTPGLCMSTCVGLFLFTRILIPDVMLTLTIALAMWAFLRVLDEDEPHPRLWAFVLAASLGVGLLLKSLIARAFFPSARRWFIWLLTRQLFSRRSVEAAASLSGAADHSADRRAVARAGDAAQSAVFRFHACTARRANITASSGSTSSTSRCCAS